LRQQERGEVVFLAGAGVSIPAGLPDFPALVTNVYHRLGEQWANHPAEAEGMAAGTPAPDRTLFALQQRLAHGRERIRQEVEAELLTPSNGTDGHFNLLRLSRGATYPRLLTTNFDPLFERVWRNRLGRDLDSWAAAGMPAPGSADFQGVFHLHGRLADPTLGLAGSDLVLNSAEFGDAYLRSGWASRYLYDLLRHANVVIIGYRLSDPPTRYLFEALSADRERFQFKDLYAFGSATPGTEEHEGALWRGRGAIPLMYDPAGSHVALYATIAGWADYAENPTQWAEREATRILSLNPSRVGEDDWSSLDWILSRGDASRIIEAVNPRSRWIGPLIGRLQEIDPRPSLGPWIGKRLGQADMIDAVLRNPAALDEQTRASVITTVRRRGKRLQPHKRRAWRMLIAQVAEGPRDPWGSWFDLQALVSAGDCDRDIRRAICDQIVPRAQLSPLSRWPGSPSRPSGTVRSLAEVDMTSRGSVAIDVDKLLAAWPKSHDRALLADLATALQSSLAEAQELGRLKSSVWDVPSVSRHAQNKNRDGYYPVTRMIADLWDRVAASDRAYARGLAEGWRDSGFELLRRLWLYGLSDSGAFAGKVVGDALINADDDTFWGSSTRREVMSLLAKRWNDIPVRRRSRIEARIMSGEPS
jgi:hypothetical protein